MSSTFGRWCKDVRGEHASRIDGLEARTCDLEAANAAASADRKIESQEELGKQLREAHERIAQWNAHALVQRGRIKALEGDLARANATIGGLEEQRDEALKLIHQKPEPKATTNAEEPERANVSPQTILLGRGPAPVLHGGHVHQCPECFEFVACDDACSCDVDMDRDDGTPCGHQVVCDPCSKAPASREEPHGAYRHWKGGRYIVHCTATHSETKERLVIYIHEESAVAWARPVSSWNELVTWPDGSRKARFVREGAAIAVDEAAMGHMPGKAS